MKRENLIGYMTDPASLNQSSLPEVEELLQSYPYFQTAHMLLARNHHNMDSVKFHDILRSTAAFAGDRKVLYYLIHSDQIQAGAVQDEKGGLSGKLTDILQRESEVMELELTPAYSVEDIPVSTELEPELEPEPEPEPEPETEREPEPRLERESESIPESNLVEEGPEPGHSQIDEYTFTGWFDHITKSPEVGILDSGAESGAGKQGLIDKFLDESPVIRPDKEKETDKSDRSKVSGQDSDSLMTETLAMIYVKQGKFRKAIYAYEKLSLKFPEKSTYFASQINRIKSNLEENR